MKREYTKLFSFILGITFITSGIIFSVTRTYREEKQEKIDSEGKIIDEIVDVYGVFKTKTEDFSNKRDDINDKIADYILFYNDMPEGYEGIIENIKEYETYVTEIEDSAIYLKDHCKTQNYSSTDANSKCNSYIINYEKTVNTFVGDIEFFNNKIKEYNEWIIEENKEMKENEKYPELKQFVPEKYKDYIDIDNDNDYLGSASD